MFDSPFSSDSVARRLELPALEAKLGHSLDGEDRLAASIITRSEIELFGASAPRFARRRYFTKNSHGFVNLRRGQEFIFAARLFDATQMGLPEKTRKNYRAQLPTHPAVLLLTQSHIADCILPVPLKLRSPDAHYICVQERTFHAYGEQPPKDWCFYTPYVKNIDLGCGLCGQAVAFMANVALDFYSSEVCGLSEITVASQGNETDEYIGISQMRKEQIQHYFSTISLRMKEECALSRWPNSEFDEASATETFRIIESYIASGIPVFFPTDLYDLHEKEHEQMDQPIFFNKHNKWVVRKDSYKIHDNNSHVMMLVGTNRGSDGNGVFYAHDPASLPFMELTLKAFSVAGRGFQDRADLGQYWPETPEQVRMPLLFERTTAPQTRFQQMRWGLIRAKNFMVTLSANDQSNLTDEQASYVRSQHVNNSEFRLFDVDRGFMPNGQPLAFGATLDKILENFCISVSSLCKTRNIRWVWFEKRPAGFAAWNAEIEAQSYDVIANTEPADWFRQAFISAIQ
jgi:hypothetical protein